MKLVCIICSHINTRREIRNSHSKADSHLLDFSSNKKALTKLNVLLTAKEIPTISLDNPHIPTALCTPHLTKVRRNRDLTTTEYASLRVRLTRRKTRTVTCTDSAPCTICSTVITQHKSHQQLFKPKPIPDPTARIQAGVVHRPHRRRRESVVSSQPPDQPAQISVRDLAAVSCATHLSARKTAAVAASLAHSASSSSNNPISIPNPNTIRQNLQQRNRAFGQCFTDLDCKFSPIDSTAYVCTDIVLFVQAICAFQNRPISELSRLKLSGDSGRGSLKISLQVIFSDDRLLQPPSDSESPESKTAPPHGQFSSTGASRTYMPLLIRGATESFDSVSYCFTILQLHRLFTAFPTVTTTFTSDFKYLCLALGLQSVAASHGYPYSLWSARVTYSKPQIIRTAQSLLSDAPSHHSPCDSIRDLIHSTARQPAEFALASPNNLLTTFPPPLLHILQGIVKRLYNYLDTVDRPTGDQFLQLCGVNRSVYRGLQGTDFTGNDCITILTNHRKLLTCQSIAQRHSRHSTPASASSAGPDTLIIISIVQLLQKCFSTFYIAYSSVAEIHLSPQCLHNITTFAKAYSLFAATYVQHYPHQASRSTDLLTPKMHCFITEIPEWIRQHRCTLARESEQGSESLHLNFSNFYSNYSVSNTRTKAHSAFSAVSSPTPSPKVKVIRRTAKRQRVEDASAYTESQSREPKRVAQQTFLPANAKKLATARRLTLLAVVAFNSSRLPFSSVCERRMRQAGDQHQVSEKPKMFVSDGRSGASLRCLIREWTSNDSVSNKYAFE